FLYRRSQTVPDLVAHHASDESFGCILRTLLRSNGRTAGRVRRPPRLPRHRRFISHNRQDELGTAHGGSQGDVTSEAVTDDDGGGVANHRQEVVNVIVEALSRRLMERLAVPAAVVGNHIEVWNVEVIKLGDHT